MELRTTDNCIRTTIVSSEDNRFTYEIRKEILGKDGKTGIVIMLYPSITDKEMVKCDNTTQALIDHMDSLGWNTLRIINLFSKVCKARMSTRGITLDNENIEHIRSVMQEKGSAEMDWTVAWGSSMSHCTVANNMKRKILSMIKEYHPNVSIKQLTANEVSIKNENAIHPLYLKIRNSNSTWYLEDYQIPYDLTPCSNEEVNERTTTKHNDKKKKEK